MRGQPSNVGDDRVSQNGYRYTRTPQRWRLAHHVIMEEKLGRPLKENERVVFVDKDKNNLDPSNLAIQVKHPKPLPIKKHVLHRIQKLEDELEQLKRSLED